MTNLTMSINSTSSITTSLKMKLRKLRKSNTIPQLLWKNPEKSSAILLSQFKKEREKRKETRRNKSLVPVLGDDARGGSSRASQSLGDANRWNGTSSAGDHWLMLLLRDRLQPKRNNKKKAENNHHHQVSRLKYFDCMLYLINHDMIYHHHHRS